MIENQGIGHWTFLIARLAAKRDLQTKGQPQRKPNPAQFAVIFCGAYDETAMNQPAPAEPTQLDPQPADEATELY